MEWHVGDDYLLQPDNDSWRTVSLQSFFGAEVDLGTVMDLQEIGGLFEAPAESSEAKRQREPRDEDRASSNKRRTLEDGQPDVLPSFQQNTLQAQDVEAVEAIASREKALRAQSFALLKDTSRGDVMAAQARLATERAAVTALWNSEVLKPGMLVILDATRRALDELGTVLRVAAAARVPGGGGRAAVEFLDCSFGFPLKKAK
jgi:hypothetical protein